LSLLAWLLRGLVLCSVLSIGCVQAHIFLTEPTDGPQNDRSSEVQERDAGTLTDGRDGNGDTAVDAPGSDGDGGIAASGGRGGGGGTGSGGMGNGGSGNGGLGGTADASADAFDAGCTGRSACVLSDGTTGLCQAGACRPCIDPADDAACVAAYGAGQLCIGGHCLLAACRDSRSCAMGQLCATTTHSCGPCADDTQCTVDPGYGAGFICVAGGWPQRLG
jgi:hypothetical protein